MASDNASPPTAEPGPSAAPHGPPDASSNLAKSAPLPTAEAAEAPRATIGANEATRSWEERTRERKHELQALREKEKATLGAQQRRGAKERLAYLMKQTDVFAQPAR